MKAVNHIGSVFLRTILLRMKELGVTKTALAKKMRVSRPYITNLLSGKDVNITFRTAYRLAKALQMDFFPELSVEGARMPRTAMKLQPSFDMDPKLHAQY